MMQGHYDPLLVSLSILVAIVASFTALTLAARRLAQRTCSAHVRVAGGSISMGVGIWSMHFIGMLAFTLPIPLAFSADLTIASLAIAVGVSALALSVARADSIRWGRMTMAAALMGAGISAMHYSGMASIVITPGIGYDPLLLAASVLVAFLASFAALYIIFVSMRRVRRISEIRARTVAAIVMGAAISGMHYTGMAAAHFAADAICITGAWVVEPFWLGTTLGIGALGLLGITLVVAVYEAHLRGRTERLNASLMAANAELTHLATHDPLTGLANRALLGERIETAIREATLAAEGFALLFIDLNRFKLVNDSAGHRVGDALLKAVANRIGGQLGGKDLLARLGGDEFVALLSAPEGPEIAARVAEAIRQAIESSFEIEGQRLHIGASIGISVHPKDGTAADALLSHADAAMYHAKQAGRDGVQFFAPTMSTHAQERVEIESGLRVALRRAEFELHYQPKVDIRTGDVVAMEALLRWRHPTKGMIPPDVMISIAEETGLIVPIGEWVLRTACEQNRAWQSAGHVPIPVAVNLSALQFNQTSLLDFVASTLAATGLAPGHLELELTESTVMSNPGESIRILQRLSELGVHISVDDFGTGYSSLAYLRRLPLDRLKIDRSFIKDLVGSDADASIVKAVISMAHSLRLQVIAEGVETAEQLQLLRELDCDQFQGFLFSPAVTAADAARFLRKADATAAATPARSSADAASLSEG